MLLGRAGYHLYAPKFFKQATISFNSPLGWPQLICRKSSLICPDKLTVATRLRHQRPGRSADGLTSHIKGCVDVTTNMVTKLPAIKDMTVMSPDKVNRRNKSYNFSSSAHTLDADGGWSYTDGKYHGFLWGLEGKLSQGLIEVNVSHHLEVRYLLGADFAGRMYASK